LRIIILQKKNKVLEYKANIKVKSNKFKRMEADIGIKELVSKAFEAMHKDYDNVFKIFYPASGSNGFTERNQTFFFTKNLMSIEHSAICWQEVPFGKKGEHIDTMIYLPESKSVIYIEAKRLKKGKNGLGNSMSAIEKDVSRLIDELKVTRGPIIERFKGEKPKNEYILILADIWEKDGKGTSKFSEDKWCKANWLTQAFNLKELHLSATTTELKTDSWSSLSSKEKYHLMIGMWKIEP
jgi:hypothetical protein